MNIENNEHIKIEPISDDTAEQLCRQITIDLPEYFGLPECNEHYAMGIRSRINFAAKRADNYVGVLSLEFPYPENCNIYWMGILREHQGQGIGCQLIDVALNYAKQHGANTITVETLSPDESDENYLKTYKFYKKVGFCALFNLKPAGYEWNMVYMSKTLGYLKNIQHSLIPQLIRATTADYLTIQNMAQFYVYDASRECGFSISENGRYDPANYKSYFEEPTKEAMIIKVSGEIAGFLLLTQTGLDAKTNWKIDQFFILTKFQGKGIAYKVAHQIWEMYPGQWEVSVIPENKSALKFWRKAISSFIIGNYKEEIKEIDYDVHQPKRFILKFNI